VLIHAMQESQSLSDYLHHLMELGFQVNVLLKELLDKSTGEVKQMIDTSSKEAHMFVDQFMWREGS